MDINLSAIRNDLASALQENERYNGVYINHEDGFVTEAEIGGKTIRTKQNSYDGFAIYDGSTFLGGLGIVNDIVALVSGILTNNVDGNVYATIGETEIDESPLSGLALYNKDVSTTDPAAVIVSSPVSLDDVVYGASVYFREIGGTMLWLTPSDLIGVRILDKNKINRFVAHYADTYLSSPDGKKRIGVDNTGAYKYSGGVKTYL